MRGRVFAILRILIGVLFLWMGVTSLLDESLLYGGLMHRLSTTGGPVRYYSSVVIRYIEMHETQFVYVAAAGEIVAGLSLLSGTFVSLGAVLGAFLVLNFGLASSSGNWLRFLAHLAGVVLLLGLGRQGAGLTWGMDALLIRNYKDWLVLFPLRVRAPKS